MEDQDQPIFTPDQVYFTSGTILTPAMVERNAGNWLGQPKDFLCDIFLKTKKVETANRFLTDINVPWRVSAINIVDGVTQWTVA
tara:strand:- start:759 stop:1010 length:252 start_codon:yes stop_codon:yes gene_type:complete